MRNQNPKNFVMNLPQYVSPKLRYKDGDNFYGWQKKAREKLHELLGLENMLLCDSDFKITSVTDCGEYIDTYFSFQSEPEYYVPCHMLMPKIHEKKLPVFICLQGHSTGMHISIGKAIYEDDEDDIKSGDRNYAELAVKKGYCAIALEQRYMGECGGTADGPSCIKRAANSINAMPTLLYGRTAIGERVHDVTRLIDVIKENPDGTFNFADTDDILLTGNSGGGTTTFYASCIDERIKFAIPSCAVCTYEDSIINLSHCGCNYIPSAARFFDMCDLAGLISPRKLIISAGKNDSIFPIDGVTKTYDFAKSLYKTSGYEENISLVIGNGGHRYYAKQNFEAIEKMRK